MTGDEREIRERLERVRERMAEAARRAGRDVAQVRLVAVSKRQPTEAIRAAYRAGCRDFGENYVQELVDKANELSDLEGLRWHHIGHLQSNKAKQIVGRAALIHGVDRASLVAELDRRAQAPVDVLVQVNVSGESAKSGCRPEELSTILEAIDAAPRVRCRGLMLIPPLSDDPEQTRPHFRALAALRDQHGGPTRLPELSMGMSHDFELAIEEGATLVRVGTAIFGERPTTNR